MAGGSHESPVVSFLSGACFWRPAKDFKILRFLLGARQKVRNPDFKRDSFADIISKDSRYSPRAYAFLLEVLMSLQRAGATFSASDIMGEFRETALDLYGPLAYFVLTEWGVERCEDIGEMMFNLVDSGRVGNNDGESRECFTGGYDFQDAFISPYDIL